MCFGSNSSSNGDNATSLPSSMQGKPVAALVPPGQCQFTETLTAVPLLERFPVSETSCVIRFGLPDPNRPLNLSTCACILASAQTKGQDVTRPYTPISTNQDIGYFDLLVKNYGPEAHMSYHLCHDLQPGEMVKFKHIPFNVKIQAPFDQYDRIAMIVGGTGVTPMIQALHAILGSSADTPRPKVTMLYGSRVSSDILGRELLQQWAKDDPEHLQVIDVLSHEPDDSEWKGERGFIDQAKIEKYFPKPTDEKFMIFICGPPPMYEALSGPREEKEVKGLLGKMGYSTEQVYKF